MLNTMISLTNLHKTLVFSPVLCSKISINVTVNTKLNSHGLTPSDLCHLVLLPRTGCCGHLTTHTVAMFSQAITLIFPLSTCPALLISLFFQPLTFCLLLGEVCVLFLTRLEVSIHSLHLPAIPPPTWVTELSLGFPCRATAIQGELCLDSSLGGRHIISWCPHLSILP